MSRTQKREQRLRVRWDRQARSYDRQMSCSERFFGDTRHWICSQASGEVLEVAVGTGLNLPHYPPGVRVSGVEWSPGMLAVAHRRAADLRLDVELREGDAQRLPYPDATFDSVVCTFSLCSIPDDRQALAEMARVLRPGGLLLLADHVASSWRLVRSLQWLVDLISVPLLGEHWRRRPIGQVPALGLRIERSERFGLGIVERLAARKPAAEG